MSQFSLLQSPTEPGPPMASLSLHRASVHRLPHPSKLRCHPFACPPSKSYCIFKPTTTISCTGRRLTDSALASELAMEVAKLKTQRAQKQEAMKKSREVLFWEICKSMDLKEDGMRKKWRRMGEEERRGLVKEFLGHWGLRFHPLSARSVKEMVDEYVNEEEDSKSIVGSSFFPGLKRWMGFPDDN